MNDLQYLRDTALWTGIIPFDILRLIIVLIENAKPVGIGDTIAECVNTGHYAVSYPYVKLQSDNLATIIDIDQNIIRKYNSEIVLLCDGEVMSVGGGVAKVCDSAFRDPHIVNDNCSKAHQVVYIQHEPYYYAEDKFYKFRDANMQFILDITDNKRKYVAQNDKQYQKMLRVGTGIRDGFGIIIDMRDSMLMGDYYIFATWDPDRKYVIAPKNHRGLTIECDSVCIFGNGLIYSNYGAIGYYDSHRDITIAKSEGTVVCAWDNKIMIYYPKGKRLVTKKLIL